MPPNVAARREPQLTGLMRLGVQKRRGIGDRDEDLKLLAGVPPLRFTERGTGGEAVEDGVRPRATTRVAPPGPRNDRGCGQGVRSRGGQGVRVSNT